MQNVPQNNFVLNGPILSSFLKIAIPSMIGFMSISSAAVVDGIFVGNYLGSQSLAAINLLMPMLTFVFGIAFMFAVGGSVRAGKYIGEPNLTAASSIFSKTLISCFFIGIIIVVASLLFDTVIYQAMGATPELYPLMAQYFLAYVPFLIVELVVIGLYYFIRLDGFANLAAVGLTIGALMNVILDYIFIVKLDMGLTGAGLATGLSQILSLLILIIYFTKKDRKLTLIVRPKNWFEILQSAYNGLSEFINEVSGGVVAFLLNWIIITSMGVGGVAAITIINYLIMMGMMMNFSVSEAAQVFVSQNFGANNQQRIVRFMLVSFMACLLISAVFLALLLGFTDPIIQVFLDDNSEQAAVLAYDFVWILWPIFIFNGISITISAYLTAIHHAKASAVVALSRSLILPCGLLAIFYYFVTSFSFLWALPVAEIITFLVAVYLFVRFHPNKIMSDKNLVSGGY